MIRHCSSVLAAAALASSCAPEPDPLPEGNTLVRYLRVLDSSLSCFQVESEEPLSFVFRDQDSWEQFFDEHVTCETRSSPDEEYAPISAPDFGEWDDYVLVGVVGTGGCFRSGCGGPVGYHLWPVITIVRLWEGAIEINTAPPTSDALGPCGACMQLRDFILLDRRLVEAYPIEFHLDGL